MMTNMLIYEYAVWCCRNFLTHLEKLTFQRNPCTGSVSLSVVPQPVYLLLSVGQRKEKCHFLVPNYTKLIWAQAHSHVRHCTCFNISMLKLLSSSVRLIKCISLTLCLVLCSVSTVDRVWEIAICQYTHPSAITQPLSTLHDSMTVLSASVLVTESKHGCNWRYRSTPLCDYNGSELDLFRVVVVGEDIIYLALAVPV